MKIVSLYYDRFTSATTSLALKASGYDHTVLCHSEEDRVRFINSGLIGGEIISTGNKKGLAAQYNYAMSLVIKNDWVLLLSDDYIRTLKYTKNNYIVSDIKEAITHIAGLITIYPNKAGLIGLSSNSNHFYNSGTIKKNIFCDGRIMAVKNIGVFFDESIYTVCDYDINLQMRASGLNNIVSQKYVCEFGRNEAGGIGTIMERSPEKIKECIYLSGKYPSFCRIAEKPGEPIHIKLNLK